MARDRDRRGTRSGAVDEGDPALAPGKRSLTQALGKAGRSQSQAPGRVTLTDRIPLARMSITGAKPGKMPAALKQAVAEAGAPLPDADRWSQRFGVDLRGVQLVTGPNAERSAQALDAHAFALGDKIFFGKGVTPTETLLAHELTHVVQQRGAAMPAVDDLQVTSPHDAVEREAHQAEGDPGAVAQGSGAVIARDEKYTTTAEYISANAEHLRTEVPQQLDALAATLTGRLKTPFVTWGPGGAAAAINRLKTAVSNGAVFGAMGIAAMKVLLEPRGLELYVDRGRLVTRTSGDGVSVGDDTWAGEVATAVASGLISSLGDALDRVAGRYAQARAAAQQRAWADSKTCDPALKPQPPADDIICAHPADRVLVVAAVSDNMLEVDLDGWRKDHPSLANATTVPKLRKDVTTSVVAESTAVVENPGQWFIWVRSSPADATAEEAALSLFGAPDEAFRFHVTTPPLFAFSATMVWTLPQAVQDKLVAGSPRLAAEKERRTHLDDGKPHLIGFMVPRPFMDDPQGAAPLRDPTAGLPPALADEAALANAKSTAPLGPDGKPKAARARDAILAQMYQNEMLLGDIEKLATKMSVGADAAHLYFPEGLVASVQKRLDARRAKLATAPDADVVVWDGQTSQQGDVIGEAIAGLTDLDKQLAVMSQGMDAPAGSELYRIARSTRLPLVRAASAYVNVAASSELPDAARAQLAQAKAQVLSTPAEMMDLVLTEIQTSLAQVQNKKISDQADAANREAKLRVEVAKLRQALLAKSPDANTLMTSIWAQIQDLQTETTMIANIDGLDQAWGAMGDIADSFGVWGAADKRLRDMQGETIVWKGKWDAIRLDWRSATAANDEAKKQAVKTRFDALRQDPALADYLSRAQAAMKDGAQRALIAKIIVLLAIAVVTMGVGAYVSGIAGGAMGVAAGTEATGSAAFVIGASSTIAESLTAAALNQAFLAKGWDWGEFGTEFAYNVLLFGALRGVSAALKVGKLGVFLEETGTKGAAEAGTQALTLSIGSLLKAEYDKKPGEEISAERKAEIVAEATVMFVVSAILGRVGKPLLQKLQNAGGKLGTAIAEANSARGITADAAKGVGKSDLKKLKDLMAKDAESLKKDIAALEELQRAASDPATRELLKAQGMSDEDIAAISRDLPSSLIRLKVAEALGNAEQAGGNNFNIPKDECPAALARLQKAGGIISPVGKDPITGARVFEAKFGDGSTVKVFEKAGAARPGATPGTAPTPDEAAAARQAADEAEQVCKRRDEQLTRLIQTHRGGYIVVDEVVIGAGQAGVLANSALGGGAPPGIDITAIPSRINIAPEGSMFARHGDFPIGQGPGDLGSSALAHQPGEFHTDHAKPINASDYVRALTMTAYETGQVTYKATADNIELNPHDGTWPAEAKDATARITADGVTIYVRSRLVSAAGMGPGRSTGIKGEAALIAAGKLVFAQDSLVVPGGAKKVLIIGAGPSGEWAVERALALGLEVVWQGRVDTTPTGAKQTCPPEIAEQMKAQGVPEDKIDFFWKAYNKRTAKLATKSAFDNIGKGPGKVELRTADVGEATIDPAGGVKIGDLHVDGVVAATGQVANLPPGMENIKFTLVVVEVEGRPRLVGLDPVDADGKVIPGMRLVGAQAINPAMGDHIVPSELTRFRTLSDEASVIDVPELSKGVKGSIHQTNKSVPAAIDAMPKPPAPYSATPVVPGTNTDDDKDKTASDPGDGISIMRSGDGPAPGHVPLPVRQVLEREQGAPLPDPRVWSERVGGDVSDARIVTGDGAARAAASINARAFTVGNRVFFGAGHDATTDGGDLLAHELTHVTQQRGGSAPAAWEHLPIVDHGDPREAAARAHEGGAPTGGQAIARDTGTTKSTKSKPGTKPTAAPVDEQLQMRLDQMQAGLVNVTLNWKVIGGDLFTGTDKPTMPVKIFEAGAYALVAQAPDDVEVIPVEVVLAGPGREEHLKALHLVRSQYQTDKPALDNIKKEIDDLIGGGQVHQNATRLMAQQALLSPNGKRAVVNLSKYGIDDLNKYVVGDCDRHGRLEGTQEKAPSPEAIIAAGKARVDACRAIVAMLKTGAPIDPTLGDKPVERPKTELKPGQTAPLAPEVQAKVDALTVAVKNVIANASDKTGLLGAYVGNLVVTLEAAGPQAREVVWADHALLGKLLSALDPASARGIIAGLDPVERLYKSCQLFKGDDDKDNWVRLAQIASIGGDAAFRERMNKDVKLKEGGSVYGTLRTWLLDHATDQAMRGRVLQHTKLKNEFIDRLSEANARLIYRLIVRGTETPTPEDSIHEAAETNKPAEVVRGLRALAGTDRKRLAALEQDAVFRSVIEKMTAPVEVDGQMVSPYQFAITLWGHEVGAAADPTGVKLTEIDPDKKAGAPDSPLSIEDRIKLNTQLFDACIEALRDEVTGRKLDLSADQLAWLTRTNQIGNAQKVMDILVDYNHRATIDPYVGLLRREKLVFGPELQKRYNDKFGESLRDWIYKRSGPVNRSGSERVLGTEQGAGVGMFNGQIVMAGEASKDGKMTLEQALRETVDSGKSISEHASVESHKLAGFIKDSDVEHVLSTYGYFDAVMFANRAALEKQTGIKPIRTVDLMRNAFMLHSGHLESRLADKFSGPDLARIRAFMGLTADVDKVVGGDPPSIAQQAEQRFGVLAKLAWTAISGLAAGTTAPTYVAARVPLDLGKLTPMVLDPVEEKSDPNKTADKSKKDPPPPPTTAASVGAGQAGHDVEERPPRSFAGYYRAQYGIAPERHAVAVLKAMKDDDREVPIDQAAKLLNLGSEWAPLLVPGARALAEDEDGSIGPHNRHLVRASFTQDVAKHNAKLIWAILHGDGRLALIEAELYGNYNDEEQRLIRIAFRALSGGIDLTFYVREAMEYRRRMAEAQKEAAGSFGGLGGMGMSVGGFGGIGDALAGTQRSAIGAEGTALGGRVLDAQDLKASITTMGDDAELDRALAVSMHGEIDARTRVRNAVQRREDSQVLRVVDELTVEERRQILGDGALVDSMEKLLSSKDYERVYKIITGQADLADRMLSRTVGNTFWKKHVSGKADQEGMKEDVKTYVRHLRLQFDREVRLEVAKKFPPPNTPPAPETIDREVNRRTQQACYDMAADKDIKDVIDKALGESDAAEVRSVLLNAGEAKDWALVADSNAQQIIAEIHTLSAEERQHKLEDPAYLQMLGARLPAEKDYRDAMNALKAGADKIDQGAGGLAKLDEKSRTKTETFDPGKLDGRETLRALTKLSPAEQERLRNDPAMQMQVMAALEDDDQRKLARELLFADQPAAVAKGPDGKPDPAAEDSARLAFLTHQSIFRMKVACQTSHKWSVVIEESCEVFKANLEPAPTPGVAPTPAAKPAAAAKPGKGVEKKTLRDGIWEKISDDVQHFADHHDLNPGATTTETITGAKMIEIINAAILGTQDPSDYLIQAKIWTADEQNESLRRQGLGQFAHASDAEYKEEDLIAAINSASDEHVAREWTSVASPGQTRQQTMKDVYQNYQTAFKAAQSRMDMRDQLSGAKAPEAPALRPATAAEAAYDPNAPMTAAPKPTYREEVHSLDEKDPLLLEEERTKRLFLEYTIEVSQALEKMLRPFMGDNREMAAVSKNTNGVMPNIAGTGNKRYDNLAEQVLSRASNLDTAVLAKVLGMDPDDTWLLKTEMRRQVNSFGARHEKNLRSRGAQTSERGVASTEKQDLDTSRIDYGRAMAVMTTDGKVDMAEKVKLDQLGSENDRAREAYKTALETSAMWASLIVGTLLTIVVTILTGGLALGPIAAMALGAATAALSAGAKALVNRAILDQEYDTKDAKDMIVHEVLTGLVQAGSAFYAAKLLKVVSNLGTVAKQSNAMRQVLQEQPGVWRTFLNQTGEQVASTAMGSVVEAGLEATNPQHFIDGYEEGNKEAWAAASARMKEVPGEVVSGVLTSLVASAAGKAFGKKGSHVDYPDAVKQKRAVNMMSNVKKIFGDPEQKIAGALVEWAMANYDNPNDVDWYAAPGELFAGALRQYGQVSQEVHSHTAMLSMRGKQMHDSEAIFGHLLTPAEKTAYHQMNEHAGNTDVFVSAQQYAAIRSQVAMTGLGAWEAKNGPLTTPQREAFVTYVRGAPTAEELSSRAHSNPLEHPEVRDAKPPSPPPADSPDVVPVVTHPHDEQLAHQRTTQRHDVPVSERTTQQHEVPVSERTTQQHEVPVSERPTQRDMQAVKPEDLPAHQRTTQQHEVPSSERPTLKGMAAVEDPTAPKAHVDSGPRKVFEEHPAITKLGELPPETLIGAHQQSRVEPALQAMSHADYQKFRAIEATVTDPVALGFLYKAVAAGSSIAEIHWLAGEMAGKDANWLIDNLTLGDPRGVGGGIKQQWLMSCNASMTITMRGNADPVFSLKMRLNNESIGDVHEHDPSSKNLHQADLEKQMLEKEYKGDHAALHGTKGRATPRASADQGAGRFADDLLNDQSAHTGAVYKPEPHPTGARVLAVLEQSLGNAGGLQVPLVIGNGRNVQAHYVLVQFRRVSASGEVEYSIHDTASGATTWVKAHDIANGTMPLGWSAVGTIEVPTASPPKHPVTPLEPETHVKGAHDDPAQKQQVEAVKAAPPVEGAHIAQKPGAATDDHDALKAGLDSLNSDGSFDYRVEKVKQIRRDLIRGSDDHISPDVSPEVVELMKEHIHDVSDAQLAAIQGYSSQDYEAVNKVMRDPAADPAQTAKLKPYVDAVKQGLAALPSYEGEAYRGTAMSARNWAAWEAAGVGGIVSDPAFSSSSKNVDVAEEFLARGRAAGKTPVFMTIQSVSGKQIEFLSRTANEAEVLFTGGAKFKIISIHDGVGADGLPRKEVYLREVVEDPAHSVPGQQLPGVVADDEPQHLTTPEQNDPTTAARPTKEPTPEVIHHAQAEEEVRLHRPLSEHERVLLERLVRDHGSEAGRQIFDKQRMPAPADQRAMEKPHAQIEVHSHFMGNVDPEGFKTQLEGAGVTQQPDQLSSWEPLLAEIVKLPGDHIYAKEPVKQTDPELASDPKQPPKQQLKLDPKTNLPIVEVRGATGDALAQAREAQSKINELKRKWATADDTRRAKIVAEIDEIAKSAVDKSLRASDETDFNSSYEMRDELVKKFYGSAERRELLQDLPTTDIADPAVQAKYREHFAGRPDVQERISRAAEAGKKLAEIKSGARQPESKNEVKDLTKLATSIADQMAYDSYAMDTLQRLAEDNIRYTEQSNSTAKLDARFDEAQLPWLKAKLVEKLTAEGRQELAKRVQELGVKHVAMVNTGMFGSDDPNVDTSDVRKVDTNGKVVAGRNNRPARDVFNAEVAKVVEQTKRKDVVGVDIAGMEHYQFDGEGKARFKYLYEQLLQAAYARGTAEGGEPIVLRPHVGEGAGDVEAGKHGARDTDRQTTKGGDLTHYERGRKNLEALISVLEEVAAEHNGKLPPEVIVRFGHATHTTPDQAARMAKLGIISEVNLQSNVETGAVSQNKDVHAARGDTHDATTHQPDPNKREPVLDDHSFTTQVFNNVKIILSTDAHSVMSTDLGNEYALAKKLIDSVINGKRAVKITGAQASIERSKGGTVADPGRAEVVEILFSEMSPEKQAQFRAAYERLYEDAHEYYNRRPKSDGGEGSPAHEAANREVDTSAWDTAAKQKTALESARKGTVDEEQRKHLISEVKRQVPDIELATKVGEGKANTIVSVVFPGGGETGIKRMNDELVGYALSTELIKLRDSLVKEVFSKHGLTIVDQSYKSTTLATSMPHDELAKNLKAALSDLDGAMQGLLLDVLHKGTEQWTATRDKHPPGSEDYKLADKRVAAITKLAVDIQANGAFRYNMQVGTADLATGKDASYGEILATKMNANKAAIMAREEGLPRGSDRGDSRAMAFDEKQFVQYAKDAVGMKEQLATRMLPFHGEERPVIANGQVDRDLLRALRKGKLDPKAMSEEQRATLKLLEAYFNRVNSFDYLKRFTKNETEKQTKQLQDAKELAHQLEIDMPITEEAAQELAHVLGGTRSQADTASAATFYHEAEQRKNRVVLNADIKDMGLDLFESNANATEAVASGKKNVADASHSASDGIVQFKRHAENAFRKFYTDELLPAAIAKARAQHRNDLVDLFQNHQEELRPMILLGGDEITVSLHHGFEELGLVPLAVAKLNSPEVANARVSVTQTGDNAGGRAGHVAAMDRSQVGHDLLKSVEEMSRDLSDASEDLGPKQAAAAKALATRMAQMYTVEQGGKTVLVDPAGKPVDLEKLRADVAAMKGEPRDGGLPGAATEHKNANAPARHEHPQLPGALPKDDVDHVRVAQKEREVELLLNAAAHDKERSGHLAAQLQTIKASLRSLQAGLDVAQGDEELAMAREDVARKLPDLEAELAGYRDHMKDAVKSYQAFERARTHDRATWKDNERWEKAKADVTSILAEYKGAIVAAVPDATVKFRGSLASGWKGPHKVSGEGAAQRFNPREFDCDAFVEVSDSIWKNELTDTHLIEDGRHWATLEDVSNWSRAAALQEAQHAIIEKLKNVDGYQREEGEPHFALTLQSASETRDKHLAGNVYPADALKKGGAGEMEDHLPDDRTRDTNAAGKRMPEVNEEI